MNQLDIRLSKLEIRKGRSPALLLERACSLTEDAAETLFSECTDKELEGVITLVIAQCGEEAWNALVNHEVPNITGDSHMHSPML
jgi:hypothetical protein